jgi:hypothetical protein
MIYINVHFFPWFVNKLFVLGVLRIRYTHEVSVTSFPYKTSSFAFGKTTISLEMLEGSKEVMHESLNLEKITQEITGGMNEMASGADQMNTAVHHVSEISDKNRNAIETLLKKVSRFKVE